MSYKREPSSQQIQLANCVYALRETLGHLADEHCEQRDLNAIHHLVSCQLQLERMHRTIERRYFAS